MSLDQLTTGLIGSVLDDKYELESVLGTGGAGTVYLAKQLGLGRHVAVKVLHPDRIALGVNAFRAEALAASRVNHPNAIAIYDVGECEGLPYLVMEYLRGTPLSSLIEAGPMDMPRVIDIVAQVLSALEEAHTCGVIHCDLTSDNVIVDHLRGDDHVKVIDFGLARLRDQTPGLVVSGTAEYMAPEQIRGGLLTPAIDVYAVGTLLYEMIVGRTPFAGSTVDAILDGQLDVAPMAPMSIVPSCPPALSALVEAALSKAASERPQSASEMRDALLSSVATSGVQVCGSCASGNSARLTHCANCGALLASPIAPVVSVGGLTTPTSRRRRRTSLVAQTHILGREDELAAIEKFAEQSSGGFMRLVGPQGVGKTAVVTEFGRRWGDAGIIIGERDPSGLKQPWYPMVSVLEEVLGLRAPYDQKKLKTAIARCGLPERDLSGLAELLGIARGATEAAVRKREAVASACRALTQFPRRRPSCVIVFLDVDGYDDPTRGLLAELRPLLDSSGLHVIATAEHEHRLLNGETLELSPLSPVQGHQLATRLVERGHVPAPESLHALTAGFPAAIEHIAGWINMGLSAQSAPSTTVDLISARLLRLPAAARRLMQAVAVHGTVAPRWLVDRTIEGEEKVVLDSPALFGLLRFADGDATIPSSVVASVVSACTPADVRRRLHSRALHSLGDDAPPGLRGIHAEAAGEVRMAYQQFLKAGVDSHRRFDSAGASRWYGRAVGCARQMVALGNPRAGESVVAAAILLAETLVENGEVGLAGGVLGEAQMFQPTGTQLAALERARGVHSLASGKSELALDHFGRCVGAALAAGDLELVCQGYLDLAAVLDSQKRSAEAREELAQAINIVTLGVGISAAHAPRRIWRLAAELSRKHAEAGEFDTALEVARGGLAQARRHDSANGRGQLSSLLAQIYDGRGDVVSALRFRAKAIEEMRQLGDRRSTAELLIASARADQAGGEDAHGALRLARRLAEEIGWSAGVALTED